VRLDAVTRPQRAYQADPHATSTYRG
jgi:hypothetical protein